MDGYAIISSDQEQPVIGADWSSGALSDELEIHANSADLSLQLAEEQSQLHDILAISEMPINDTGSGSDSDGSSGNETDKEPGKYFYPGFEELVNPRPPEVGMRFQPLKMRPDTIVHMLSCLVLWQLGDRIL